MSRLMKLPRAEIGHGGALVVGAAEAGAADGEVATPSQEKQPPEQKWPDTMSIRGLGSVRSRHDAE
jgi:hypothetical protein